MITCRMTENGLCVVALEKSSKRRDMHTTLQNAFISVGGAENISWCLMISSLNSNLRNWIVESNLIGSVQYHVTQRPRRNVNPCTISLFRWEMRQNSLLCGLNYARRRQWATSRTVAYHLVW